MVLYARGATHLVDALADLGADAVSLDWRVDLGEVADRLGERVSLQGNLDPGALLGPAEGIAKQVAVLVAKGRRARGHVLNLGHGVQPGTPVEHVAAFVEAARQARAVPA